VLGALPERLEGHRLCREGAMRTHTPDIYKQIGKKIRELRTTLKGKGISQEDLAPLIKATANTISRWETATYKPSISNLERLARFFRGPITAFFPQLQPASRMNTLASTGSC
jgi:transcriptional regulator with XRE-family HTH domain